jgi:hypothetical protein
MANAEASPMAIPYENKKWNEKARNEESVLKINK